MIAQIFIFSSGDKPWWGGNKNLEGLMLLGVGSGWGTPSSPPIPIRKILSLYIYFSGWIIKTRPIFLKNEKLKVCKISLFNLKKNCLSVNKPQRKMLNGLIKLVFTPDELATAKTTDKRKNRLKALHQGKCSIVGGLYFISCSLYTCIKNM